jgi:hypothetical protein
MTTLFSDNFNRTNSTTIGGNWSEVASGDWEIISNAVREPSAHLSAAYLINTTSTGTADYSMQADITQGALVSGSNRGMGIVARYIDINNFYLAWINEFGTPVQLYSVVGGVFTVIGSWTPGATIPDPLTMRLECQGTTIRVFINGTSRISVTDSGLSSAGNFGLRVYSGSDFSDHRYDNVAVADFAAGGTTVNPGYISTAEVVYAPAVTRQVLPGTIATAEQVYGPTVTVGTVSGQVSPGTITSGEVVYGPTITLGLAVSPSPILSAEVVYAPVILQALAPPTGSSAPTQIPVAGRATGSNYLDWPQHSITSSDVPPLVGNAKAVT